MGKPYPPANAIEVWQKTGGTLRILSNDLDAPAKEIADLYKRRWLNRAKKARAKFSARA